MAWHIGIDGSAPEYHDDTTRVVTIYGQDGLVTSTRPYTEAENLDADLRASIDTESANQVDVENKIDTVDLPAMQAILDQTNAQLREDPSQEIKAIARAVRRLARNAIRRYDSAE